jgi:hypothetical protein
MKIRRAIVALLTFLGGLYFVLEFVVPPTMPFATVMGVALDKAVPKLTVQTQEGGQFVQEIGDGVTVFVRRRDTLGKFILKDFKSRMVGVGEIVTLRTRTVTLGAFDAGATPIDKDGKPIAFKPGEYPFPTIGTELDPITRCYQRLIGRIDANGRANLWSMGKDDKVNVEVQEAKIRAVDRGSVTLLVEGKRKPIVLADNSLVMRVRRRDDPEEINVFQANVGDTLRIGPNTLLRDQRDTSAQFNAVLGTLALGMGLLSLGMVNYRKIKRREKEWYTGILFFAAVILGVCAGFGKYEPPGSNWFALSDIVVVQVIGSMGAAIFSLLAFYLASAAYRAFRVRTAEAAIMMVTALIIMLGQTPLGTYLTGWIPERFEYLWFSSIAGWILRIPSSAFVRALTFGAMLGAIAQALRYLFSMERMAMGDD